jgi:hypothetical protein
MEENVHHKEIEIEDRVDFFKLAVKEHIDLMLK